MGEKYENIKELTSSEKTTLGMLKTRTEDGSTMQKIVIPAVKAKDSTGA